MSIPKIHSNNKLGGKKSLEKKMYTACFTVNKKNVDIMLHTVWISNDFTTTCGFWSISKTNFILIMQQNRFGCDVMKVPFVLISSIPSQILRSIMQVSINSFLFVTDALLMKMSCIRHHIIRYVGKSAISSKLNHCKNKLHWLSP